MSLRDGDLVICRVCGRLSFYRGYTTCPHYGCYARALERVAPGDWETIEAAMERLREPPPSLKAKEVDA